MQCSNVRICNAGIIKNEVIKVFGNKENSKKIVELEIKLEAKIEKLQAKIEALSNQVMQLQQIVTELK